VIVSLLVALNPVLSLIESTILCVVRVVSLPGAKLLSWLSSSSTLPCNI
jgi:hypothetical protein